jgi:hypothetical protein
MAAPQTSFVVIVRDGRVVRDDLTPAPVTT